MCLPQTSGFARIKFVKGVRCFKLQDSRSLTAGRCAEARRAFSVLEFPGWTGESLAKGGDFE